MVTDGDHLGFTACDVQLIVRQDAGLNFFMVVIQSPDSLVFI